MSLDDIAAPAEPVASSPEPTSPAPETAPAAEAPDASAREPDNTVDDDLSKVWAKHNPTRGEDGKFVARETPAEPTEPAKTEANGTEQPVAEAKPVEPSAPVVEAPRSWTSEQKAIWSKIPAEAHPIIAQREAELHDVKTMAGRMSAEYKPIRDAFAGRADYVNRLSQSGMPPAQWLENALDLSQMLDTGHAPAVIKHLAEQYGVDLGQIYDPMAPAPNPELVEVRRELASLKAQRNMELQNRAASEDAARIEQFQTIADQFLAKYPDAREIESDIIAEIQTIRAKEPNLDHAATLEKAYERAAWAHPATRDKRIKAQLADQLKAQEEARVAAAKEAAAKAKAAASVNVSGSPAPASPGNIDDDLRAIWRKRNAA